MASAIYPLAKKAMLDGDVDLLTDTIKVALVDTGTYTYSAAHDFFNDVSGVVGTPGTITNKTTTGGVFDGDNVTIAAVTGASIEAVVVYKDTGNAATSQLLSYHDGLSLTPNGGDITVTWHASGIFAI